MTASSVPPDPSGPTLGACPQCDLLYRRHDLAAGERGLCPRCGAKLHGCSRLGAEGMLALTATALICLIIANCYPIVDLSVQGLSNSATLSACVAMLWREGHALTAVLVTATTQVFPLLDLLAMAALLSTALRRRQPPWFAPLFRLLHTLRPWGMIEVFMLGVVVSLVKLLHLAHLVPGAALWAFAALAVLMTLIQSLDLPALWHEEKPE